jgi:hypothetical protein
LKPVDAALTAFVCSDVLAQCAVWVSADTMNRNNAIDCLVMLRYVEKWPFSMIGAELSTFSASVLRRGRRNR